MSVNINNAESVESLPITVYLKDYPIALENKVQELLDDGSCRTREQALEQARQTEFTLEVYYEKDYSLFAVDSLALECGCTVYSPYSGEECIETENAERVKAQVHSESDVNILRNAQKSLQERMLVYIRQLLRMNYNELGVETASLLTFVTHADLSVKVSGYLCKVYEDVDGLLSGMVNNMDGEEIEVRIMPNNAFEVYDVIEQTLNNLIRQTNVTSAQNERM